jgi:hypothetical protein
MQQAMRTCAVLLAWPSWRQPLAGCQAAGVAALPPVAVRFPVEVGHIRAELYWCVLC